MIKLKEEILALQERCKQELGVEVQININAHSFRGKEIPRETARVISEMLSGAMEVPAQEYENKSTRWFSIVSGDIGSGISVAVFFEDEVPASQMAQ